MDWGYSIRLVTACGTGDLATLQAGLALPGVRHTLLTSNEYSQTLLHIACRRGHPDMVRAILALPSEDTEHVTNLRDWEGLSPIHAACAGGCVEMLKLLLSHPAVILYKVDKQGWTCLHHAAANGRAAIIRVLLPHIIRTLADYQVKRFWRPTKTRSALTALDLAIVHRHMEAVKVLLCLGRPWLPRNFSTISGYLAINALVQSYVLNSEATVSKLRLELGFACEEAAALFAIVVFLSEGLLAFRIRERVLRQRRRRFLQMLERLPVELQMRICCLTFGLDKPHLLSEETEPAFCHLAAHYLSSK